MTQFFVRKTRAVRLPDGSHHALVRGLREVPDQLAHSADGHQLGIVAINEMTDQERADFGLPLILDVEPEAPKEEPKPTPTPAPAPITVSTVPSPAVQTSAAIPAPTPVAQVNARTSD